MKRIRRFVTQARNGVSRIDRCDGASTQRPVARHPLAVHDLEPPQQQCTAPPPGPHDARTNQ